MTRAHAGLGATPEDRGLFSPEALPRLRAAREEVDWLLGRGYPLPMVLRLSGDHHQLHARQRLAVQRSACSAAEREDRARRRLPEGEVRGRELWVDGFNLLVTLEVALAGGPLLCGGDGALRDLAGMRGSFRCDEGTEAAVRLLGEALAELGPSAVTFLLDAPVSNSGRLRGLLLEQAVTWGCQVDVELVADPDPLLSARERVVSSDAAVLDRCASWVGLAGWIVAGRVAGAWVVELGA